MALGLILSAKLQKIAHICKKNAKKFGHVKKKQYFCIRFRSKREFSPRQPFDGYASRGAIAQLVEQRTENPCVTGSIPVGTTKNDSIWGRFFVRVALDDVLETERAFLPEVRRRVLQIVVAVGMHARSPPSAASGRREE